MNTVHYRVANPSNNEKPTFAFLEDAKREAHVIAEKHGRSAVLATADDVSARLVVEYGVRGGKVVPVEYGPN